MTDSVVMTLAAPLQAWGGPAVSSAHRPTDSVPSLSGVTGLIANALGHSRIHRLDDLAAAQMHIRSDRPGRRIRDFHTVGTGATTCNRCGHAKRASAKKCGSCGGTDWHTDGVPKAESLDDKNRSKGKLVQSTDAVAGDRWYLSDAAFTVVWTPAPDGLPAAAVAEALCRPARPLYLGRRSCPPGYPVLLGVTHLPPDDVLTTVPLMRDPPESDHPGGYFADVVNAAEAAGSSPLLVSVQHQIDSPQPGASARNDVPVTFDPASRWHYHHSRWTLTESLDLSSAGCAGRGRPAHVARREVLAQINAGSRPADAPD